MVLILPEATVDSTIGRIEVNAAIERLLAQPDDAEAARVIIEYGVRLKGPRMFSLEVASTRKSSDDAISGYSPGHGNITINDERPPERKEWLLGMEKDRVGHFRLWRASDNALQFQHFWKSSLVTQSHNEEGPDEFMLGYDPTSLKFEFLGVVREKTILEFSFGHSTFQFFFQYLESLHGKVPSWREWWRLHYKRKTRQGR